MLHHLIVPFVDRTVSNIIGATAIIGTFLLIILGYGLYKIKEQRKIKEPYKMYSTLPRTVQRKMINCLSRQEIEESEQGVPEALERIKSANQYSTCEANDLLPYNSEFEVAKEQLTISKSPFL